MDGLGTLILLFVLCIVVMRFAITPSKRKKAKNNTTVTVTFQEHKPEIKRNVKPPKSNDFDTYPWDRSKGNADNEFANTIFLNSLNHKALPLKGTRDDYPRMFSYHLKIYDPLKKMKSMLDAGYLRYATAEEILSKYKVAELKPILEKHGLPTTGKKADLVFRICEAVPHDALNLPVLCCTSEKGLEYIEQHPDMLNLSANPYGVTYDEYIATKNSMQSYMKYDDVIWAVFNRRELFAKGDYNTRMNNAYNRAEFLKAANKLQNAMQDYIFRLFFEMNDPSREVPDWLKDEEHKPLQITPDVLESIFQLKEHYTPDMIDQAYERISVPKVFVKRKDFERLVNDIFAGKEIDVLNYLPKGMR